MKEILRYLKSELKYKVLVVGDLILDKYYFGNVERISPEAPVPVVHIKKIDSRIGGAGNTALNLKNLGVNVDILGIVGNDESANELLELIENKGFSTNFIYRVESITPTKIRIVSRQQHLIRIDFEEVKPISIEDKILKLLENIIRNYDIVIISDYNKGLITENISQYIINSSKFTIIDPKGKNWQKYKNANIITPNVKELSEGLNLALENEDKQLEIAGKIAIERYNVKSILITRSEKGLSYIDRERTIHVPTIESEVYDVSGAGDTVVASLAFGILCNIDIKEVLKFANLCASIVIKHIGTYAIRKEDILSIVL